jgi:hypothetical protein
VLGAKVNVIVVDDPAVKPTPATKLFTINASPDVKSAGVFPM